MHPSLQTFAPEPLARLLLQWGVAPVAAPPVAERLGEWEKAIESYRFVTEAWRRPDPELQPYVSEAREALARLARTE